MIRCPRIIIAGLGGDTGKTAVSVGICRVWQKKGYKVIPFKKGPDYIDMEWLSLAAGRPCYNLDLFLMNRDQTLSSFGLNTQTADFAVIEGNRGLFDGMDAEGSVSTAELAKLLQAPVIIIVDCTKVTRTVAAMVLGCQTFDPGVRIEGVILNRLAGSRQETVIQETIENRCNLPVVGAIPKLTNVAFPGRHLGLVPPPEHPGSEDAIEQAAEIVSKYLDMGKLQDIAHDSFPVSFVPEEYPEMKEEEVTIGVIRDSAFQFYYPENIDALKRAGAHIIEFSALTDELPPFLDALYIGGGFPETHAHALSSNDQLRREIREAAEEGLPIYAECGGLMYLAEELLWNGEKYPMAGIFPMTVGVSKKPEGHGYTIIEVESPNQYFKTGQILHGHEFHYSHVLHLSDKEDISFAFDMKKGKGIMNGKDGICYKNVLATYSHIHALGTRAWTNGIISRAVAYKKNLSVD